MRIRSSNPAGWRGESYRHYLAAKGVKTTHKTKYFASDLGAPAYLQTYSPAGGQVPQPLAEQLDLAPSRASDLLKGNRKDGQYSDIQKLRTKKWTDQAILANSSQLVSQGLLSEASVAYLNNKARTAASVIPEAPAESQFSAIPLQPDLSTQVPDLPVAPAPTMVQAPSVNLDQLEDDLPRDSVTVSPSFGATDTSEATQGLPAGLRREMMTPTVMTSGAPEAVPDYDLRY